jgi:hypothetical protein
MGSDWGFIESQSEIAQNFELLMDAKSEIDAQGPNAGLQGRGGEGQSGRAIMAQQNAGLAEENTLFDTHNDWKLRAYRAFWARAKQFWTEPMWLRISDEEAEEGQRFTPVNQPDPEQMQAAMMGQMPQPPMGGPMPMGMQPPMPQPMGVPGMPPQGPQPMPQMAMGPMGGGMMGGPQMPSMNRLAEMDVDIIIEAAPDMISLQHEQFEQLTQMAGAGVPIPPDVLLEASQLRNKRQLISRMKEDGDLQAQLQKAQEQMKQMQMVIQQQERQLLKQLPEGDGQMPGQPPMMSPLDMARAQEIQAKAQDMARKAERDDALAGADIALKEAQAFKTVTDATRPPPAPRQPRGS